MAGTPVIGATIAQLAFWILIVRGVLGGELRMPGTVAFVLLWVVGCLGLPWLLPGIALLVPSYVAVLDVALVFAVFKGDIRLT